MSLVHFISGWRRARPPAAIPQRILLTGAAGKVGAALRAGLARPDRWMRLLDRAPLGPAGEREDCVRGDIRRFRTCRRAVEGMTHLVHLAGIPREADWRSISAHNMTGTFNLFEAARRAGIRRVIFASTNHVTGFYRTSRRIGPNEPARPDSLYGVSKLAGEGLGRLYADKHGLSIICVRLGWFGGDTDTARGRRVWLSPRDAVHLFDRCLDVEDCHFRIVYGVSGNAGAFWDNGDLSWLGYEPRDGCAEATPFTGADPVSLFQGGHFAGRNFNGDPNRIS